MSRNDDLHDVKQMMGEIHTALFGPKSNPEEGIFAITKKNEREIAGLRTSLRTLLMGLMAIPTIAAIVALFAPVFTANSEVKPEIHQ